MTQSVKGFKLVRSSYAILRDWQESTDKSKVVSITSINILSLF